MNEFDDDDATRFLPGDTVRIDGLKSAAQHNGKLAKVRRWIPERGRWALQLPDGKEVAVRTRHLQLVERLSAGATDQQQQLVEMLRAEVVAHAGQQQQLVTLKVEFPALSMVFTRN